MNTDLNKPLIRLKKMLYNLKSTITKIGFGAVIALLVGCNNNVENDAASNQKAKVGIEIIESGYDNLAPASRAVSSNSDNQKSVVDFNDCGASTELVPDQSSKEPATRAITGNTHYTIRFYEGSTRVGELKGRMNGSTFTPDAGTSNQLFLMRGKTYTFVCFNDDVVANGESLEVSLDKAATARIGRQTVTTGTTWAQETVKIISKHAGVRVRTQIQAQKHTVKDFKAKFLSNSTNIPNKVSYNPVTGVYTTLSTAALAASENNSPNSTEARYTASGYGKNFSYTSTAPFHYLLPGTDAKNLKMDISEGQIFWKNMEGSINSLVSAGKVLEANGTYTIAVKIKPYFTYLFSDGTTGLLHKNPGKTPVGVVVDPVNHLAAAIEEAGNGTKYKLAETLYDYVYRSSHPISDVGGIGVSSASRYYREFSTSGYDETWNASYAGADVLAADKVRGESDNFPAFKAAATFRPTAVLTGTLATKKWFLPSQRDYFHAYDLLGFADRVCDIGMLNRGYDWYSYLFESAFTAVGGVSFVGTTEESFYWTSTEHNGGSRFEAKPSFVGTPTHYPWFKYKVRSFVQYD